MACAHASCTNGAPVAQDDGYTVTAGGSLSIAAATGVLANDSDADPEGSSLGLRLVSDVRHGTLNLNTTNGSFTYTPAAGFAGVDHFSYRASDGSLGADAIVAILVRSAAGSVALNTLSGSMSAGGTVTGACGGPVDGRGEVPGCTAEECGRRWSPGGIRSTRRASSTSLFAEFFTRIFPL